MQPYELNVLLDILEYSIKQDWELSRFISYVAAQSQSTKNLKLTDIIKFSWDKGETISTADIERLKRKAQSIINKK